MDRLQRLDGRKEAACPYSRLAFEARQLWLDLQQRAGERLLVDCGCLNLVKASVTPDVPASYAVRSFAVLEELQLRRAALPGPTLAERFPQFAADGGYLTSTPGSPTWPR